MSANVQCAGGGQIARDPAPFGLGPTHYERATNGEPCGWKGERRTFGHYDRSVDLAKPCPRCSGKVKLIKDGER